MNLVQTLRDGISEIVAFLPNLIGFLVLLIVGFIVAKVLASIVRKLLEKVGVDRHLQSAGPHNYVERFLPGASAAAAIAKVVFYIVFAFFFFSAIGALKVPALTTFMNSVLSYLPNIIVAILIFVVASLVSGAAVAGVTKLMGDTPTGKIVATIVPALVMVIALFMILEQLQIAPEIIRIAFGAVMFALALGLALAFGLGGRTVAQQLLEDAYRKGQAQRDQVRQDLQQGKERGQDLAGSQTGGQTGGPTGGQTGGQTGGPTGPTYGSGSTSTY